MTQEPEIKCPDCGSERYSVVKDTLTFDGWTYRKMCLECGRRYD